MQYEPVAALAPLPTLHALAHPLQVCVEPLLKKPGLQVPQAAFAVMLQPCPPAELVLPVPTPQVLVHVWQFKWVPSFQVVVETQSARQAISVEVVAADEFALPGGQLVLTAEQFRPVPSL